jgi:hypothetical protein
VVDAGDDATFPGANEGDDEVRDATTSKKV